MDHFDPPVPSAASMPAADVQARTDQSESLVHQAFPVRQPAVDADEFLVQVRASTLRRCRSRLANTAVRPFPWHELLLGTCTLSMGGVIGAVASGVEFSSIGGMFFYALLPALGAGTGVAYLFQRARHFSDPQRVMREVLEDLPDPEVAR